LAFSVAVSIALAFSVRPAALVPVALVGALAYGAFYSPGMSLISAGAEESGIAQGLAFGLMNAAWALGHAVGPVLGGALAGSTGDAVPFLICAGICAATLLALRARMAGYTTAARPTR